MIIKWFGHSCFKIDAGGINIVTDPFDGTVGYKVPETEADIVSVSHGHFDHNYTDAIKGNYELISKVGMFYVKDINIKGIASFHDKERGRKRGSNIIYTYDIKGTKLCHLGDLGHVLDNKQVAEIGAVDVLFIPVGGYYTIDASEARKVVNQLKPRIIFPMHYKTPAIDFPIETEKNFVNLMGGAEYIDSNTINIEKTDTAGKPKVYILKY